MINTHTHTHRDYTVTHTAKGQSVDSRHTYNERLRRRKKVGLQHESDSHRSFLQWICLMRRNI